MEPSRCDRHWPRLTKRLVLLALPVLLTLLVSSVLRAQSDIPVPAGGSALPFHAIWPSTVVDADPSAGRDFDAVVDGDGQIQLVYLVSTEGRDAVKYAVGAPGAWLSQTVTLALTDTQNGGFHAILNPRIVIDENNDPHIVYWMSSGGDSYLHYAYQDAGSWVREAIPDTIVPGSSAHTLQLGFASDGAPLIVYAAFFPGPRYDLYWIRSNVRRPVWQESVDVASAYPGALELHALPHGAPVVLYTSETTTPLADQAYGLYRAQLESADWSTEELSTTVPVLEFDALIDDAGNSHLFSAGDVVLDGAHYSQINRQVLDAGGWTTDAIDLRQAILKIREAALQDNGQPAILYANTAAGELYFAWLHATLWSREQALTFPRSYDDEVDLVFANGVPNIVHAGMHGGGLYIAQRTAVELTERVYLPLAQQAQ